jgi:twitching motility protein PilI
VSADVVEAIGELRACVFTVGAEAFAFEVRHVREVLVLDELTAVPGAPSHVLGVANLRGDVLPIVDAGRLLGVTSRRAGRRLRTLVIVGAGGQIAIPIDDVLGLETFAEIVEAGDVADKPYAACVRGRMRRGDGLVTLLDVDAAVAALRRREG